MTGRAIGGYAAVYESRSRPIGSFTEIVERSAFSKSRGDGWPNVVCRFEHLPNVLLGTTAAGTLELRDDRTGLDYTVELPNLRDDVLESVQRGDVQHSSFSFEAFDVDWSYGDGITLRHLTSLRLIDVAPVSNPAYPDASVALRSLAVQHDASYEEVRKMDRDNELRRLFVRTDRPTLTGRQALFALMAMTPQALYKPTRSVTEMRRDLTDMMNPHRTRTPAQARTELTRMAKPLPYETAECMGLD